MMWQIETFNRTTRRWEPFGSPAADFGKLYAKTAQMAGQGFKTRVTKLQAQQQAQQQAQTCKYAQADGTGVRCTYPQRGATTCGARYYDDGSAVSRCGLGCVPVE